MKPQDIVFIIAIIVLFFTCWKRPSVFVWAGLLCLALSIPLFSFWIFFTAQRLLYYGAGFLFVGTVLMLAWEKLKK